MCHSIKELVFPGVGLVGSSSKGRNKVSVHGENVFAKHEGNILPAVTRRHEMSAVWSGAYLGGG